MCIFQGKDFERTMNTTLQIGVKNQEDLWICKSKGGKLPTPDSINVTVKVIDVNDPPEFLKNPADVYLREEELPGKELFTPKIKDVDSKLEDIRLVSTYCMPAELKLCDGLFFFAFKSS